MDKERRSARGVCLTHVYWCEEQLIACYSCDNSSVLGIEVYSSHEELVPFGCCRTEDC
jgi:hypothetical protein